jgi:hypothetical protein
MPKILMPFTLGVTSCLLHGVPAFAQSTPSQSQSAKPKVAQPKAQRAEWTTQVQAYYGISQDEFNGMGLPKLSLDEYAQEPALFCR